MYNSLSEWPLKLSKIIEFRMSMSFSEKSKDFKWFFILVIVDDPKTCEDITASYIRHSVRYLSQDRILCPLYLGTDISQW